MKFDDVVILEDGGFYIFKSKWIYKLNRANSGVSESQR